MGAVLTPGVIVGLFGVAAGVSNALHYPALAAFFSDPTTASQATSLLTAGLALGAGFLKGYHK